MKAKSRVLDEDAIVERLIPKIEDRVRADIIRGIIASLEEQLYPSEESFRKSFVERVKKAGKSKGAIFKTKKELEAHLRSIGG
ncbi:MAG: hypothetical protein QMD01_07360 [Thermodesulfovibrionales bacterium]|nr:hypothetical protein [Thermodesulfovibrionales bacterium]